MLVNYPYASILDKPGLRALVLKAVAWGPPGETLATVAAKLLHSELLAYVHSSDALPDQGPEALNVLLEPVVKEGPRSLRKSHPPLRIEPLLVHGIALLEFDPLGAVVNIAYLAAGRGVLGPFLGDLADLAHGYGFQALECYSRRPGMGKLLARHGWQVPPGEGPVPGFRRHVLPLAH